MIKEFETSDNVHVSYLDSGEGLPLLFIHGWAATKNFWRYQTRYFSKKFRVIALDLRGHGDSDKFLNIDYSVDRLVKDVSELLNTLSLKDFVLIGHSLGGVIALKSYKLYKQETKGLVLTGTPTVLNPGLKGRIECFILKMLFKHRILAEKILTPKMFSSNVPSQLLNFVRAESAKTPPQILLKILEGNRGVNVKGILEEIEKPVLILVGSEDSVVKPKNQLRMKEMLKKAEYIEIKGAGHNVMLEKPEKFNEAVKNFLEHLKIGRN